VEKVIGMNSLEKLKLKEKAERNAALALLEGKRNYLKNQNAQQHLIWARQAHSEGKLTLEEALGAIAMKRKALHGRAQARQSLKRIRVIK